MSFHLYSFVFVLISAQQIFNESSAIPYPFSSNLLAKSLVVLFHKGIQLFHKFLHNTHHVLSEIIDCLRFRGPA